MCVSQNVAHKPGSSRSLNATSCFSLTDGVMLEVRVKTGWWWISSNGERISSPHFLQRSEYHLPEKEIFSGTSIIPAFLLTEFLVPLSLLPEKRKTCPKVRQETRSMNCRGHQCPQGLQPWCQSESTAARSSSQVHFGGFHEASAPLDFTDEISIRNWKKIENWKFEKKKKKKNEQKIIAVWSKLWF